MGYRLPGVIYIVGSGRSGSTLLDILLGAGDECFSCGELINMVNALSQDEYCSCGDTIGNCSLWSRVLAVWRVRNNLSEAAVEEFGRLDRLYGRSRSAQAWCSALFPRRTYKHRWYLDTLGSLLEIISEISGRQTITDSSKSPVRMLQMRRGLKPAMCVVHLVRDPMCVVTSLNKSYTIDKKNGVQNAVHSKSPIRTAMFWAVINIMSEFALAVANTKRVTVRFEDMVLTPEKTIQKIFPSFRYVPPLVPEHVVAGNRMRMQKSIIVGKTDTLKTPKTSVLTRQICRALGRRYRYR